jgi:hypothetical protein
MEGDYAEDGGGESPARQDTKAKQTGVPVENYCRPNHAEWNKPKVTFES